MKTILYLILIAPIWVFGNDSLYIYFDSDKDSVKPIYTAAIQDFLTPLISSKDYIEYELNAYTDSDASELYNINLSYRRMMNVEKILQNFAISENVIFSKFHGEQNPIATNKNENGKQKNRRVLIVARRFSDYKNISNLVKDETKTYRYNLNSSEKINIITPHVELYFPENAFTTIDNKNLTNQNVNIELLVVNNIQDAIANQVFMQSPQGILVSGGMFKITVKDNNNNVLKLRDGKSYTAFLPADKPQNNMNVYTLNTMDVNAPKNTDLWQKTEIPFNTTSRQTSNIPLNLNYDIIANFQPQNPYTYSNTYLPIDITYPPKIPIAPIKPKKPWYYKPIPLSKNKKQKQKIIIQNQKNEIINEQRKQNYPKLLEKYSKDSLDYTIKLEQHVKDLDIYKTKCDEISKNINNNLYYLIANYQVEKLNVEKANLLKRIKNNKKLYDYKFNITLESITNNYNFINNFNAKKNDFIYIYNNKNVSECIEKALFINNYFHYEYFELYNIFYVNQNLTYNKIKNNNQSSIDFFSHIDSACNEVTLKRIENLSASKFEIQNFYQASLNQLNWINCDRFLNVSSNNMVAYNIPNYHSELSYYIIIPQINSIITASSTFKIPKNIDFRILSYGVKDNQLVYDTLFIKKETSKIPKLEYKPVTSIDLKDILDSF
jgi:hypothetical protein